MAIREPRRAWLLMAAGDDRGYGGNEGYDDEYNAYYSWDSKVVNHKNLMVGDPVALWDKRRLLGVSVIEEIERSTGQKLQNRCPACRTTAIKPRKTKAPTFRCDDCKAEFDTPRSEVVEVEIYRARYDAAWTDLDGLLNDREIREVQTNKGEFNAMRRLDWASFRDVLARKHADRALSRVVGRIPDVAWGPTLGIAVDVPQGFRESLVRVRRGQREFREALLAAQGQRCAFTGAAPARVLEAGHLYSYARIGEHRAHGGLMLRRDIHRLFDDGLLAVDPERRRVDVAEELGSYAQYARLHQKPLTLELRDEQVDWLAQHWAEHRTAAG